MYKSIKTMTQALQEARAYRDSIVEDKGFSSQQIKMAYGILNDPRYKGGNYSGAFKAIEKIAKGLASHPDVANALKRANEELEEAMNISTAKKEIQKIYDKAKKDGYLGGKGHDDFKDLLQQTDTKKLYPKMHKLGTYFASASKFTPGQATSKVVGNELIDLSYKIN